MAELVDALDLGSCGATRKSSSLFTCTNDNFMATRTHLLLFDRTNDKKDLLSGNF